MAPLYLAICGNFQQRFSAKLILQQVGFPQLDGELKKVSLTMRDRGYFTCFRNISLSLTFRLEMNYVLQNFTCTCMLFLALHFFIIWRF
jgi:hypothetical protein